MPIVILATGCFHFKVKHKEANLWPIPPELKAELTYPLVPIEWFERTDPPETNYRVLKVSLMLPVADAPKSKLQDIDCYLPPSTGKLPVVVDFPISGGTYFIDESYAKFFYSKGIATVIVYRELNHSPNDGEKINALIKQSILDNKRVIDWITSRGEFDTTRIAALGTSLGSLKAVNAIGVDKRISATVAVLTGCNLADILANSKEGAWHRAHTNSVTAHRETYMREHHMTRKEFQAELKRDIKFDPGFLAPCIEPKKVLLIIGLCDTVVPTRTGRELRRKMQYPETIYIVSGHYTALVYWYYIRWQAQKFIVKTWNKDARYAH